MRHRPLLLFRMNMNSKNTEATLEASCEATWREKGRAPKPACPRLNAVASLHHMLESTGYRTAEEVVYIDLYLAPLCPC